MREIERERNRERERHNTERVVQKKKNYIVTKNIKTIIEEEKKIVSSTSIKIFKCC